MKRFFLPVASVLALLGLADFAHAGQPAEPTVSLTLKNHLFTPASLVVPQGVKVRIVLTNLDGATEEFDSHDLKIEQLVTPHGRTSFLIGPLRPGTYTFMGEFHPDTAQGRIIVGGR